MKHNDLQQQIDELNNLTADDLESKGIIQRARKTGYICPFCANGSGSDGTGINVNKKVKNYTSWHCFGKCGRAYNNLQLLAEYFSLDCQSDFVELVKRSCDLFGISYDDDDSSYTSSRRTATSRKTVKREQPAVKFEPEISPAELEYERIIQTDIMATPPERLAEFVKHEGGFWRGLPLELLQRFDCRYVYDWTSPKFRNELDAENYAKRTYITPTQRILIPTPGKTHYLARFVGRLDNYSEQTQKYIQVKEHAGRKRTFNEPALKNITEPVFCFEGEIDAMTAEYAGYHAVATCSAPSYKLLVESVRNLEVKPQIIILFDPDETGRKKAPELQAALKSIGCPAVIRFLSAEDSKLDVNEILTTDGVDKLRAVLQAIYDEANEELAEVEPEPEEVYLSSADYDLESTTADDDSNYFRGDLSDEDFAIRLESFCGANVRWLTDDNKWAVYRDGVWHIHSDKKSAVLPCARDLSSTLTKFARSADDKKIAKCFKSTVKQSAAITLLTGAHAIRITSNDLDKHPELLNALNGVVDLSTGKLYPHDSSLLLTQQVNASFNPAAKSEIVDKFFRDIQPDETTRNGLWRWLGYCLSGEVREEKFMVWYGTGANGKGLLSGTLLALLGNYGCGLTPRALLKKSKLADDSDRATTALNPLRTSRFAISEEVPSDAELDCSILKNLTGGDRFNLRKNYGEYESVKLSAKLNISGNYLPRIENINDGGMLRRLLNMPFKVQFGTAEHPRDDQLKAKMIQPENLSALLAILVREAGYWYKEGLIISDEMQSETRRHLSENNFIADFIDDNGYEIDLKSSELIVNVKRFLDDLRAEYPREVSRFKRADLIKMIERVTGAVYTTDNHRNRIFSGIGKVSGSSHDDFFGGEPINPEDVPI